MTKIIGNGARPYRAGDGSEGYWQWTPPPLPGSSKPVNGGGKPAPAGSVREGST